MSAIHLINRRDNGSLRGLTVVDAPKALYESRCWALSDAGIGSGALVGGYVYLHATKGEGADFGGRIVEISRGLREDGTEGDVILFEAKRECRGVRWRGAHHRMAWTSGLIEADLAHERQPMTS